MSGPGTQGRGHPAAARCARQTYGRRLKKRKEKKIGGKKKNKKKEKKKKERQFPTHMSDRAAFVLPSTQG
jgi:hypothetical protein